jgi:hypothetical protein
MQTTGVVDAYMHVGQPRFGSAAEALMVCDRWGIDKTILVLGPGIPDIAALAQAQRARPGAVRTMGIPYGDTREQRLACGEACFEAGAIGLRLQSDEALANPTLMAQLGERGGWAYATDPLRSPRHTEFYLEWLARFPQARIGAPHFLGPDVARLDNNLAERLLTHPRFHAILSRQGQCASREPPPHRDLKPWVERVIGWCGWTRILWGSEYPVLYWRNEQIDRARHWLLALGVKVDKGDYAAFCGGNAQRLFFSTPASAATFSALPDWLSDFPTTRPVTLAPNGPFALPMDVYEPLLSDYLRRNNPDAPLSFEAYLVEQLRVRAQALREEL